MTERVVFHVGSPKSGTTYLQRLLRDNVHALGERGILVAGERHRELVHAAMLVREDPRAAKQTPHARGAWDRLVAQIAEYDGHTAVISYELFSVATAEQAERALAALAPATVELVVTSRDLGSALTSAWQERLKFKLTTPLGEWTPPAEEKVRSEWGWRSLDPAGVLERWGATLPAERRHLVTVPRGAAPDLLWSRFCEAAGLGLLPVIAEGGRRNSSMGAAPAEVLRRVNAALGDRLDTGAEQIRWTRDLLANTVLADPGLDGSAPPDPITLPPSLRTEATERYARMTRRLDALGVTVHGDLADLDPDPHLDPAVSPTGDGGAAPGRLPEEVPDADVAAAAVTALADLLATLRERERAQERAATPADHTPPADVVPTGVRHRLREVLGRGVHTEVEYLHRRVDELQDQLFQARSLQHELAEVTDIVAELLLPAQQRDDERVREAIRGYRQASLRNPAGEG